YEEFHDRLEEVKFVEGVVLSDIATVMPSRMKDYILIRILPRSETGFMI
ncbi:MAG TPA: methanogenesis marker 7 protein, partial [Candidatus Methanoperedenaceae archaeon]|nr:methanogenesis marker 7 protein [Candidatus Methanoperedenaceae archaeon]